MMNDFTNDKFYQQAKECAEKGDFQKAITLYKESFKRSDNYDSAYALGKLCQERSRAFGIMEEQKAEEQARQWFIIGALNNHAGCVKELLESFKRQPRDYANELKYNLMFGKDENFDHLYAAFNASSMDEGKKLDFIGEYIEILKKVQNEALIKKLVDKIGFMIPKALGKTNTIKEMDKIADRVLPYIPADMIEGFYGYYAFKLERITENRTIEEIFDELSCLEQNNQCSRETVDVIFRLLENKEKEERERKEREERERKEREERERKEREERERKEKEEREIEKKRNELKEIIQKREIKKLVHFTPKENVESILKCGILPRADLERKGMIFCFNDESRIDKRKDAICLSITSYNHYLLRKFKTKYQCRKYVLFEIKPQILLDMNIKRYYCDYNAAASDVDLSAGNIEIMFKERQTKIVQERVQNDCRLGKNDNEPTSVQAEILFFGRIAPEDIIGWKEI